MAFYGEIIVSERKKKRKRETERKGGRERKKEERKNGTKKEKMVGGERRKKYFKTQDLSTRGFAAAAFLPERGVNVIGRIIANHPVSVQVDTRDILAYPLVLEAL